MYTYIYICIYIYMFIDTGYHGLGSYFITFGVSPQRKKWKKEGKNLCGCECMCERGLQRLASWWEGATNLTSFKEDFATHGCQLEQGCFDTQDVRRFQKKIQSWSYNLHILFPQKSEELADSRHQSHQSMRIFCVDAFQSFDAMIHDICNLDVCLAFESTTLMHEALHIYVHSFISCGWSLWDLRVKTFKSQGSQE